MSKYRFPRRESLDISVPSSSFKYTGNFDGIPLFSFASIDLSANLYGFNQKELIDNDFSILLEKLKLFSNKTINELINLTHDYHFHYNLDRNTCLKIKMLLETSLKIKLKEENIPQFGEFALYTDPLGASRSSKQKSPRIFFMVGADAIIYILFYDPYHEICDNKN